MSSAREIPGPQWSTTILLSFGFGGLVIGLLVGAQFAPGLLRINPVDTVSAHAPARKRAAAPEVDFEAKWRDENTRPASNERDQRLADILGELARRFPNRALTIALGEPNRLLRQTLLATVLKNWAGTSPDAAARWALRRPVEERGADITAVLQGAAQDPMAAVALALQLVHDDPALAHDHGCSLILALVERGDFDDAANFAALGPREHREAWLSTAFAAWAEHQPEAAAAAAQALPVLSEREFALRAALTRWADVNPQGLADFARTLSPGLDRRDAMNLALTRWASQDRSAAAAWIDGFDPSPEFDPGVAAIATHPALVASHPEIATDWAESIFDPEIRLRTLIAIVDEWAKSNRDAAQHYAENSSIVSVTERASLLASLGLATD